MTSIDSLRNVLELERQKGYADKAVIGGLDKYLYKQAGRIRQSLILGLNSVKTKEVVQQVLSGFNELNLANSNYGACGVEERKRWIANVFSWLDKLEKEKSPNCHSESSISRHSSVADPSSSLRSESGLRPRVTAVTKPRRQQKSEGLDSTITTIKGITPSIAKRFAKLNVRTVRDLLYFFPRRYVDYSQRKFIAELKEDEEQTILGIIWQARVATFGNRQGTEAIVGDETGNIRVVWFNQPYLAKNFPTNARVVISGTVSLFRGQKVFESPEWELLEDKELIHTGRLVPIYPLTQGLYPRQVRRWTKGVIDSRSWQLDDFLPLEIRNRCQLLHLPEAIAQIHYPDDQVTAEKARERLAFDELFLLQLGVLARKRDWQESQPGNAFNIYQEVIDGFLHCLPFTLTQAQQRVLQEILADLKWPY